MARRPAAARRDAARRDRRRARCPHGVVARGALWHVHPLGALRDPLGHVERQADRRRGVDPQHRADPSGCLHAAAGAVRPGRLRRDAVGDDREERRHEVPRDHLEAPRRLLPLAERAHRVRRRGDALQAGHPRRARGSVPARGDRALLLPLDHGLDASGLPAATRLGRSPGRGCELPPLRRPHARAGRGARRALPARGALVRRRVGVDVDPSARRGDLRPRPHRRSGDHRQQPRRRRPRGHGRPHPRRRLPRRLRHA